jgi:hypothetical protein
MEGINEIDCNEGIWNEITCNLQNGWSNLENECRFAFEVEDPNITTEDVDEKLWDVFEYADQIEVTEAEDVEGGDEDKRYFGASVIIYSTGL